MFSLFFSCLFFIGTKTYTPNTPSLRHCRITYIKDLNKIIDIKLKYLKGKNKFSLGRSKSGELISRKKSYNSKINLYYVLDIEESNNVGVILGVQKVSTHKSYISVCYNFYKKIYFLSHAIFSVKQKKEFTYTKKSIFFKDGIKLYLKNIPIGKKICLIKGKFSLNSIYTRASGCYSIFLQKKKFQAILQLSSGSIVSKKLDKKVTLGRISGVKKGSLNKGKAGRNRWLGVTSKVRGVAMNPVDHPHGGGEGKTSGGRPSVTPWSKPAHRKKA